MARPAKLGLDYFPLDVDIDQDEKLIVVIAKYGMAGFGIIIRMMMAIYKHGYYYDWTEKEQYIFSMKVGEPVERINEIVQECLKWGFFHQDMFDKYEILTSKGFQKRFELAATRRKESLIKPEYNLLEIVFADKNPENDDNNSENDDRNATKEIKVNESKEKKNNICKDVISYLNEKTGKRYIHKSEANKKLINGRIGEGRTIEDFIHVIDVKCEQWLNDPKWSEYLRPSTLFAQRNFENYVNEKLKKQTGTQKKDIRDKEIEFQKHITAGGDPDEFDWS